MAARSYSALKSDVLTLGGQTGSTDAGLVVQVALVEAMKYVATRVELVGLIKTKQYTWTLTDTAVSITAGGGFNLSDYQTPNRLYIKKDSSSEDYGVPYDFVEFVHWNDRKSMFSGSPRDSIMDPPTIDARPLRGWTTDLTNSVIAYPVTAGNVLTLFYNAQPAVYADATIPELPGQFDFILVAGGQLVLEKWLKEPDQIVDIHTLFSALDPHIEKLDSFLNSRRKRGVIRPHHSYWLK